MSCLGDLIRANADLSRYRTGLDLLRLISLSSPLPESLPALLEVVHDTSGPVKEQETNSMLAFRALANLFVPSSGKSLVKDEAAEVS